MKKIFLAIILFITFVWVPVYADEIKNLYMNIYLDENGTAHIKETWDYVSISNDGKTEIYHGFDNLDDSKISFVKASDSTGKEYEYVKWNINNSFEQKAYKYGYNYTNSGVELCMGISHYGNYRYTFEYEITNMIKNANDAQALYFTFWPENGKKVSSYNIIINSFYTFPDSLDVWGFGDYGALSYVKNGNIYMTSQGSLDDNEYIVLLAKFPEHTFNTSSKINMSFDEILNMAQDGAKKYNKTLEKIVSIIEVIISYLPPIIFFILIFKSARKMGASNKLDNKVIPNMKDVNMFRELPFDKNIDIAYFVSLEYKLMKQKNDYLGAVLLKWVKNGNVNFNETTSDILKIKKSEIHLLKEPEDDLEKKLYIMMLSASKDGILGSKEFEKYCSKNYSKVLKWFDDVVDNSLDKVVNDKLATKESKKGLLSTKDVYSATDKLNEKAIYMYGLKKFFSEFKNMEDKRVIDVHLWEEYLMYAQIFGVAKEVAKEFKNIYPEVVSDNAYNTFIYINHFSYNSMNAANMARNDAMSYSGGGGGFSSGGGGGGSFGGGGGAGSR